MLGTKASRSLKSKPTSSPLTIPACTSEGKYAFT